MILTTSSVEETMDLGHAIGSSIDEKTMISLSGDLGAGKTHLTKGIARGMGIREEVTSPTFAIIQEYKIEDKGLFQPLDMYHFDLYRITDEEELYHIGYSDYLNKDALIILEWAQNVRAALVPDRLDISLEYTGEDNKRKISLEARGPSSERLLKKIGENLRGKYENTGN